MDSPSHIKLSWRLKNGLKDFACIPIDCASVGRGQSVCALTINIKANVGLELKSLEEDYLTRILLLHTTWQFNKLGTMKLILCAALPAAINPAALPAAINPAAPAAQPMVLARTR
jgi:hypothetical protein